MQHFVILDDEPFWKWNWLSPYVVETCDKKDMRWEHYVCGLNEEKMRIAINILNGKNMQIKSFCKTKIEVIDMRLCRRERKN